MKLESKIPEGDIEKKWTIHRQQLSLVNPANKRKYEIIVVGSGLAGASAAATCAQLGYNVSCFFYQDSPRRAHSISAQGGINAAKDYQCDGDSVHRLFADTIKGGDFRSREANVYRLAQLSTSIIDHCVAQGVPFARDYGGNLDNRSFGGAQVSRTFYARGQTGQQLLLGAYSALMAEVARKKVCLYPRTEMLDLIVEKGRARGIVVRNLVTGEIAAHGADAVVLATGGYANVFYLSTNAKGCNVSAIYSAYKKGAVFSNPCFTQIHPTCIPAHGDFQSKLTLMSESLRNDGRIWVPKKKGDTRQPSKIPNDQRDYFLERKYPAFGNLVPRDVASRAVMNICNEGMGVGVTGKGVYLDFEEAISRSGEQEIEKKYGNLFQMYEKITAINPYNSPMMIYPAAHYTMGGLWVDYNLETTIEGCFAIGECNFSDHGANRLGASALMQGLADGYFILPLTLGDFLARKGKNPGDDQTVFSSSVNSVSEKINKMLKVKGTKAPAFFHRQLGKVMVDNCGMQRSKESLDLVLKSIKSIKEAFWQDVCIPSDAKTVNQTLETALRIADFLDFAQLLVSDASKRTESCGGHFRVESQTQEGEAQRRDEEFSYVSAWEYKGDDEAPVCHKEKLKFEYCTPNQRSYK